MSLGCKALALIFVLSFAVMESNAEKTNGKAKNSIVQLIELARHGARSPFYNIWDFSQNWDLPLQTLTPIGQRQHYLIGLELQQIYRESIFNSAVPFNDKTVSVVSTSSARAQQSALAQLYGIYQQKAEGVSPQWKFQASTDLPPMSKNPVKGEYVLNELHGQNLPNSYQPISVLECKNPYILESYNNCPGFSVLKNKNYQSDEFKKFDASLHSFKREFVDKFELNSNPDDVTVSEMAHFWDSVVCDIYQQNKLPDSFTQEFINKLNYVYDFDQLYTNFNDPSGYLLKLQTSEFFKDLIDVIVNKGDVSFKFYSASDGNVNAFLIAAGVASYTSDFEEWKNPTTTITHSNAPFASTIFLEVSQAETLEKQIKFIYNGRAIILPGCKNDTCELYSEFIPFLQKFIISDPSEFNSLCNLTNSNETAQE